MTSTILASLVWMNTLPGVLTLPSDSVSDPAFDARFQPPPVQSKLGPKLLIATGALLVVSGVVGMAFADSCQTKDAANRCVDPRGGTTLYPTLLVSGIATTITGSFWYRQVD